MAKEQLVVELRIIPELESLLRPLSRERYEDLKENIEKYGLTHEIIYWKDGIIIDGHNRYHICKKLGVPVRYKETKINFVTLEEVKLWMEENELAKGRDLTFDERRELRISIYNRKIRLGMSVGDAIEETSKSANVSTRTIQRDLAHKKQMASLPEAVKVLTNGGNAISAMKRPGQNEFFKLSNEEQVDILERNGSDMQKVEKELAKRRPKPPEKPKELVGEPRPEAVKPRAKDKERVAHRPAAKAIREALEHLAAANKVMYEAKDAVKPARFAAWRQRMIDLDTDWVAFIDEQNEREGVVEPKEEANPFF